MTENQLFDGGNLEARDSSCGHLDRGRRILGRVYGDV
jgi:hypothetical protein